MKNTFQKKNPMAFRCWDLLLFGFIAGAKKINDWGEGNFFFHQDCSQKSNLKVLEGLKIEAARKQKPPKHMVFQAQNRNKMRKRNFF